MKVKPRIDGVYAQGLKYFWPKRFKAMVAAKKFVGDDRDGLTGELSMQPRTAPRLNSGTASVRHSANGTQCTGAIQYHPSSPLSKKPTPIKKGEAITLRPKIKVTPADQWRGNRRAIKTRVKFTREQRIAAAKENKRYWDEVLTAHERRTLIAELKGEKV